jgi:uncharacterized protein YcbX
MASEVGTVSELWRYPVQSLQGESLPALEFTSQGVVGDRGYSIVDDSGEGGTAARPQWKTLIGWRARYLAEPTPGADLPKVEITFDDGTQMICDDARLDGAISERLGRRGRLAVTTAPDVKRPYVASPCHLLTSATLKALSSAYPSGRFVSQRFRPNVTLDCGEAVGFLENDWIGRSLAIGDEVRMAVELPDPRCVMPSLAQKGGVERDPRILKALARHNRIEVNELRYPCAGVYAVARATGTIRKDDPVSLI